MSINNFLRSRLKNETDPRAFNIIWRYGFEPFYCCCCCMNYHNYRKDRQYNGNCKKKVTRWEYRMYRTWKYYRKTQYKQ